MARARRRLNEDPVIRHEVRTLVRFDGTPEYVRRSILERWTGVDVNQLDRMIEDEERSWAIVQRMTKQNKGQMTRASRVAGCEEGQQVRVRVVVHFWDAAQEGMRSFGHTTHLRAAGRWGDVLGAAVAEAVGAARERHYDAPTLGAKDTDGAAYYTIEYARCLE